MASGRRRGGARACGAAVLDPPEFDVVTFPVLNVKDGTATECTEWLTVRAVVTPITATNPNTARRQNSPIPEPKPNPEPRRTADPGRLRRVWFACVTCGICIWVTDDV